MPVDAIYYECECGFKGFVPYTAVKLEIFGIPIMTAKRLCPKCGKEIKESQEEKERKRWICI